jgi:hypothetical protein
MSETTPEDIRSEEPNETGHRRARFRDGWRNAVEERIYTPETLRKLTWESLGNRLGAIFRETSPELVNQMYDWCVRQQEEQQQAKRPR